MMPSHQSNTGTELELIFLQGKEIGSGWGRLVRVVNYTIFNNLPANFTCNEGAGDFHDSFLCNLFYPSYEGNNVTHIT